MAPCDDWPGTYELELLAAEIRLNDPRNVRITPSDGVLAKPPATSPALVEAIIRSGRAGRPR